MTRAWSERIREHFVGFDTEVALLDGTQRPYINLDNASTTPCLADVLHRVEEFLHWYGSVGRGTGAKSQISTKALQEARRIVAAFVGADSETHTVLFAKNTTDAINKLAHRFPFSPDDVVLCSVMEHHSNDLPWRMVAKVVHIGIDQHGRLDMQHLRHLLSKNGKRVRLVAVSGGSNVTGYVNPIHEIAEMVHEAGAQILVDGAQLAAHRPIDMGDLDGRTSIDYLAFCAHKMYAPFGVGVLVGRRDPFIHGVPHCVGGGAVRFVSERDVIWAGVPEKEEAGTPNLVGIIALAEAIHCLQRIGLKKIAEHEAFLTRRLLRGLEGLDGIRVHGDRDPANAGRRLGLVSFEIEDVPHQLVAAILSAEGGIGVRSGLFCAHPYVMKLLGYSAESVHQLRDEVQMGIHANLPGFTRVSLGLYNTEAEIDILIALLHRIEEGNFAGRYHRDKTSGAFAAEGWGSRTIEGFRLGKQGPGGGS